MGFRNYWTAAFKIPEHSARCQLWRRLVQVIRCICASTYDYLVSPLQRQSGEVPKIRYDMGDVRVVKRSNDAHREVFYCLSLSLSLKITRIHFGIMRDIGYRLSVPAGMTNFGFEKDLAIRTRGMPKTPLWSGQVADSQPPPFLTHRKKIRLVFNETTSIRIKL